MAEMRRGLGAIGATGARLRQPYYLALLAEACGQTGEVGAAVKMLAEGLGAAHHHGECWHEAELHRLKGELLIGRHASRASRSQPGGCQTIDTQVERCFHQALAHRSSSARQVSGVACGHEPREAVAAQGKARRRSRSAGTDLQWFTEGFDTADIRDARRCWESSVRSGQLGELLELSGAVAECLRRDAHLVEQRQLQVRQRRVLRDRRGDGRP